MEWIFSNYYCTSVIRCLSAFFYRITTFSIDGIKKIGLSFKLKEVLSSTFRLNTENILLKIISTFSINFDLLVDGKREYLVHKDGTFDPKNTYSSRHIPFSLTIDEIDYRSGEYVIDTFLGEHFLTMTTIQLL